MWEILLRQWKLCPQWKALHYYNFLVGSLQAMQAWCEEVSLKPLPLARCRLCKPNSFSAFFGKGGTLNRKITRRRHVNTSCAHKVTFAWHAHARSCTQAMLWCFDVLCILLNISVGWISLYVRTFGKAIAWIMYPYHDTQRCTAESAIREDAPNIRQALWMLALAQFLNDENTNASEMEVA